MSAKILLAEDNATNRYLATFLLEKAGLIVSHARNGAEALRLALAEPPDLILMDLQMPEMDGFEALSTIRQQELTRGGHLPIVALTAHAMAGDREHCLNWGFDDYLSKPIRAASLSTTLDRLMGSPVSADFAP
jgi:CheY-like chemotaxis protein